MVALPALEACPWPDSRERRRERRLARSKGLQALGRVPLCRVPAAQGGLMA